MKIAILHYSVAPVVGGVEAVIQAHTRLLLEAGYDVTLVAGSGDQAALPEGARFIQIPLMDTRDPQVMQASQQLELGQVPGNFDDLSLGLEAPLAAALQGQDITIIHNIFTKHFNLPLTAALARLLDRGQIKHCIAWCHDFTWTSTHSQHTVHSGNPWDLLRTYRDDVRYVTVLEYRRMELAGLFNCPPSRIQVVYNGVDPVSLHGFSAEGVSLLSRLGVPESDLALLMPVRITQAKNIELAFRVVSSLQKRGIRPTLVIPGPPDPHDAQNMAYYQYLLELRHELGVDHQARFVYESGPDPDSGYVIGAPLVNELFRACDVLFLPSHREGFGMSILEAGLVGMPIFTTDIPAAHEFGQGDIVCFSDQDPPDQVAGLIMDWFNRSPVQKLRLCIRQQFTWQAIFHNAIKPYLTGGEPA